MTGGTPVVGYDTGRGGRGTSFTKVVDRQLGLGDCN